MGPDQDPFLREWKHRTGQEAIKIEPTQLQVDGNNLICNVRTYESDGQAMVNGGYGKPRRVEQCSLELFQDEYAELDSTVLQKLAICCTSDLRTVFVTHDKRLLGIIEQELPSLEKRGVLRAKDRQALQQGIAHTILPGTTEMHAVLKQAQADDTLRNKYIIKAVRDGFSTGIQMAKDLSQQEWLTLLEKQAAKPLLPSQGAVVVQELVDHVWYDIVRHDGEDAGQAKPFHLIGSYHMINGKLGVYGPWRIGEELHVGIGGAGKGILASTVIKR